MNKEFNKADKFSTILSGIITLLIFVLLLILPKKCNGQIYVSGVIDPLIIIGGPRIDISITNKINILGEFYIGNPKWDKPIYGEKIPLIQYGIGIGYNPVKNNWEKNDISFNLSFIYNQKNNKYYNISTEIGVTYKPGIIIISATVDPIIGSIKTGLGIRIIRNKDQKVKLIPRDKRNRYCKKYSCIIK